MSRPEIAFLLFKGDGKGNEWGSAAQDLLRSTSDLGPMVRPVL